MSTSIYKWQRYPQKTYRGDSCTRRRSRSRNPRPRLHATMDRTSCPSLPWSSELRPKTYNSIMTLVSFRAAHMPTLHYLINGICICSITWSCTQRAWFSSYLKQSKVDQTNIKIKIKLHISNTLSINANRIRKSQ